MIKNTRESTEVEDADVAVYGITDVTTTNDVATTRDVSVAPTVESVVTVDSTTGATAVVPT